MIKRCLQRLVSTGELLYDQERSTWSRQNRSHIIEKVMRLLHLQSKFGRIENRICKDRLGKLLAKALNCNAAMVSTILIWLSEEGLIYEDGKTVGWTDVVSLEWKATLTAYGMLNPSSRPSIIHPVCDVQCVSAIAWLGM